MDRQVSIPTIYLEHLIAVDHSVVGIICLPRCLAFGSPNNRSGLVTVQGVVLQKSLNKELIPIEVRNPWITIQRIIIITGAS